MINSKKDYVDYLNADRLALGRSIKSKDRLKRIISPDYIYLFQRRLRKLEYLQNCRKDFFGKLLFFLPQEKI